MTFHFYVLTKKCPSCYPSKLPQMASMYRLFSASSNCFWFCWKWQEDTYTDTCYNCSPDVPTNDVIQVCAPTGSVVFSAGGETIHRLFRVWVHQPSLLLKYTSREKLKSKFANLSVLIIDERSCFHLNYSGYGGLCQSSSS